MANLLKAASGAGLRAFEARLQERYRPYIAHFEKVVGYRPSIAVPRRYHEKMLWRKLFDHSPAIATFCDKLATRDFVKRHAPKLALPELLWTGDSPEKIPSGLLAEPAVFKCNHGCDYNFFWQPRRSDEKELKRRLAGWLASTYGGTNFEWGYSVVRPRILAERFLEGPAATGVLDINVRAARGRTIFCSVIAHNKSPRKALGYFRPDGRLLEFGNSPVGAAGPGTDSYAALPDDLDITKAIRSAVAMAAQLSREEDYARFDFLFDGANLYGGEVTPYPASGLSAATPEGQSGPDVLVNEYWDLRESWFLRTPQRGTNALYALGPVNTN